METKIDTESAQAEFDRFVEVNRIDLSTEGLDENDKQDSLKGQRDFVEAIKEGILTVDEVGIPTYTPCMTENFEGSLIFRRPKGDALSAMDLKKKNADVAKMYAAMATMTRKPSKIFTKMDYFDVKMCMLIAGFFLG